MSELEIRRLELSDAEAFMVYIANWATDTSPFKIDAVKAYAELSLENFSDYVSRYEIELSNFLSKFEDNTESLFIDYQKVYL